jgi:4-alpha-glucanotransferase
MSDTLRRENPAEERINDPANSNHYWNYRMHITLEQLIKETEFNKELSDYLHNSGRRVTD